MRGFSNFKQNEQKKNNNKHFKVKSQDGRRHWVNRSVVSCIDGKRKAHRSCIKYVQYRLDFFFLIESGFVWVFLQILVLVEFPLPSPQSVFKSKQAQKETKKILPSVLYVRPVYIYIYICTMQQCNTSSSLKNKNKPWTFQLLCKFIGKHI